MLVSDNFQGEGLGRKLTEYCLLVASEYGIREVNAVTSAPNRRMIHIFDSLGFDIERNPDDELVEVRRSMAKQPVVQPS